MRPIQSRTTDSLGAAESAEWGFFWAPRRPACALAKEIKKQEGYF